MMKQNYLITFVLFFLVYTIKCKIIYFILKPIYNYIYNSMIIIDASAYTVKTSQLNSRNLQIYTKKCNLIPQPCLNAFMIQAYSKINFYRARHRVQPLRTGSQKANQSTSNHACYLASTFRFEYNLEIDDIETKQNLYQAYRADNFSMTADRCQQYANLVIDTWYNEYIHYDFTNGKSLFENEMIQHFAQMVWKSTEEVALGLAFSSQTNQFNDYYYMYVVADYSPPGNFIGEYLDNVLQSKKKRYT